jgi:hypothetical protein
MKFLDKFKGYRTYAAIALAGIALVAPAFGLPEDISAPLIALCLALAAYFRSQV